MTDLEQVLGKLENIKKVSGGYMAACPSHKDDKPSLSLREAEDGKLLIFCHAGCTFKEVTNAIGFSFSQPTEKIEVAHYNYTDVNCKLIFQVVRYEPKGFRQRRPDGSGGWIWDLKGLRPVLYNLPNVLDAKKRGGYILLVEGEKDVATLAAQDIVATTTGGGASVQWKPEYTEVLRDAKVAIIPDNDTAGKKYAQMVGGALYGWVKSLRMIELPDLEERGDVTDWFAKPDNTKYKLGNLLNNSPEFIPSYVVSRDEYANLLNYVKHLETRINNIKNTPIRKRRDGV